MGTLHILATSLTPNSFNDHIYDAQGDELESRGPDGARQAQRQPQVDMAEEALPTAVVAGARRNCISSAMHTVHRI